MEKTFFQNILFSFTAQIVQLLLSFCITIFLPQILSIKGFSFWQLFIFYTQYAAFFHLGLVDGIYLREGGKKYSDLNYLSLGFQQRILFIIDLFFFIVYIIIACLNTNPDRTFVIIASGILMLIGNISNFYSMLLGSVNEFKTTSIGRMCFSIPFLLFIFFSFIFFKTDNFKFYIVVYIICYSFYLIYCIYNSKEVFKNVFNNRGWNYKQELLANFRHGILLTVANITGMLLLGITRFFIDSKWGIEVFGMVSYSLVLVNFVLMFISEVSSVMYPELRTMDTNSVDNLFVKIQNTLLLLTPIVLLLYYPLSFFIGIILPQYSNAISYMVYLLPVCIIEAKIMLQVNTYFKVFNKPREMLQSNLESLFCGGVLSFLAVYYLENVVLAIISMPLTIMFQYVISLKKLRSTTFLTDLKRTLPEVIIILFFISSNIIISSKIVNVMFFLSATLIYFYMTRAIVKESIARYWTYKK